VKGMMDATCPCGKRIGWYGSAADRPACPRCGHQVPKEELAALDAKLDEMRRLCDLHPKDASPADLAAMRKMAGLSIGQVAKLLDLYDRIEPVEWEAGRRRPSAEQCDRLSEIYQCG
jgi:DNA-binding transcriptional regulator YiaG